MKLKNLFLAAMTLFAFTACTDTPDSPYDFPVNGGKGVYINETFASDFGVFTPIETVGETPWIIDYKTAKATSYVDGTNKAATSWLISAPVDFTEETEAYAAFEYIIRYSESGKVAANHQLLISADYAGDPTAATWTDLPYGAVEGADWVTFYKANVAVPAEFLGKSGVVFALRYTATTKASTWEVKNFKVAHGTAAEPEEPETPEGAYISETFATSFGAFTTHQTVGNYPWIIDYSTAKATSYVDTDGDGKADTNMEATSWLVSPTIDLTNETEAYVAFEYIIRYAESGKVADNHQLLICNDFSGDVATASWVNIPYGAVEGADWNTFYKANVAVPADFLGKSTVTFALRYNATTKAGTWEVKNFVVAHGAATGETPEEPETPDTPDTPVVPSGENMLTNGSFEDWNGSAAVAWAGPAGHNATVSQSTDARTGNYSIAVAGVANSNKRLASQSYVLAAGTYTFSIYFKANGADAGLCRIGYVPIENGQAVSSKYTYETAAASAAPAEWTARVYEFTLTEQTEVAFVIMNNKAGNGASFLVDDASLTTTDGSISGGGNEEGGEEEGGEEPETPSADKFDFTAVTSITAGAQYLIVAGTNQATALDASKSYGYLPVTTVAPANGVINTTDDNVFVIEAVDGGYSIKDALGRYLYMTGNFNSVNLDTTLPAEGGVWTIEFNADGTAKITNTYNSKFMQFDSNYNSYGVYPDARGTMPTLYKKN
ncbi:MAG: carbohydrate binding domain-containing protein [Bacteroidaceae bacterium]|nr:carbohydrate binding domain-containing protein [Bacteroidaceae bacterium]